MKARFIGDRRSSSAINHWNTIHNFHRHAAHRSQVDHHQLARCLRRFVLRAKTQRRCSSRHDREIQGGPKT